MYLESGPAPSLGLLYILEDTLSVVEGANLEPERREYVLRQSKQLLDEVREISAADNGTEVFVMPTKWRACESYTLLSRYLEEENSVLTGQSLDDVAQVLDRLSKNEGITSDSKATIIPTLRDLCERMSRDISMGVGDLAEQNKLRA